MKIMKFEGATMREAVAKVKAELGDEAVIVATRQIRRGLLGTAMEISAAIDDGDDDAPRMPRFAAAAAAAAAREAQAAAPANNEENVEKLIAPIRSELRSLRALVRASGSDNRGTTEIRGELAALRKLIEEMRIAPQPAAKPNAKHPASESVSANAPLTAPSTGNAIMLVGPTGAGKTTTIAKLAARAALVEGKRVSIVTLDNYRVGGIEQIRTFADLIGVPLHVANSPAELRDYLDGNDDLVLIDTAGRSPRDNRAIDELAEALPNLPPIEIHLVIPASTSVAAIDDLAHRTRALNPQRLLFTKLDEVNDAPELARSPARLALPITWVTTGQAVPEDLEEPTSARLLELASAGLGGMASREPGQARLSSPASRTRAA